MGVEIENLIRDIKEIKAAIATLNSDVLELRGRIKIIEDHIKREEEIEIADAIQKPWYEV